MKNIACVGKKLNEIEQKKLPILWPLPKTDKKTCDPIWASWSFMG